MPSITVENYLKALLSLTTETGETGVSDLSKEIGVSTPTANSMVKRLAEEGLVRYERYRPVQMTEAGRRAAAHVLRRHRLTEMFLVEKMNFGWEEVHAIAEQVEHIDSPEFFRRMDELMDFPTRDPHGSPIPDAEGNLPREEGYDRLSDCQVGQRVRLQRLSHDNKAFLELLNARDLQLGQEIDILQREVFDSSMRLAYAGRTESFSKLACDKLLVEVVAAVAPPEEGHQTDQ